MNDLQNRIQNGLMGALVGDALGVPVEFRTREELRNAPVVGMREYGSHNQPKGTWSDDGAMLLATVASIVKCNGVNLDDMAGQFLKWYREDAFTATGRVFDIGMATAGALRRVADGVSPMDSGTREAWGSGNGSLMRILPASIWCAFKSTDEFDFNDTISSVSGITHANAICRECCVFYSEVVRQLLTGSTAAAAINSAVDCRFMSTPIPWAEDLKAMAEADIPSSGYVFDTLRASLWCLLNSNSYAECVLKAVNLGSDTDTTGCVAGGLAGMLWGNIPETWLATLPIGVNWSIDFSVLATT